MDTNGARVSSGVIPPSTHPFRNLPRSGEFRFVYQTVRRFNCCCGKESLRARAFGEWKQQPQRSSITGGAGGVPYVACMGIWLGRWWPLVASGQLCACVEITINLKARIKKAALVNLASQFVLSFRGERLTGNADNRRTEFLNISRPACPQCHVHGTS